jgi:hypothetical protein
VSRSVRFAAHAAWLLAFLALAAVMLRPLATSGVLVPDSDDAYFSIWRLAWVAHQLPADPAHLFDANIFFPDRNTLAYSDAMLMVGAAAAPLFWAGVEPARVHNVFLVLAFAGSMYAAFLLARRLTGDWRAALLAAVIFGLCPYRFAHIGHLELQWVMWMPLAMLSLHALVTTPSAMRALTLGAVLGAQAFCSIYYGVFLTIYIGVALIVIVVQDRTRIRVMRVVGFAVVPLLLVAAVYGPPYAESRRTLGPRDVAEVEQFRATLADYGRVPPQNRVHQALGLATGNDEHSLFPGFVVLALVMVAFVPPINRHLVLYAVLALLAFDASLGPHGFVYAAVERLFPLLTSFRASARFAILVVLSLSMLASLAAARLGRLWRWGGAASIAAALLVVVESVTTPLALRPATTVPTEADRFLATLAADAAIVELPLPRPDALWLYETTFQLKSINHWRRLVNGYSGFVPQEYERTLLEMAGFPDARSARRLRDLGVDIVVVNRVHYDEHAYHDISEALLSSTDFTNLRRVGRDAEEALVVEVHK